MLVPMLHSLWYTEINKKFIQLRIREDNLEYFMNIIIFDSSVWKLVFETRVSYNDARTFGGVRLIIITYKRSH